AEKSGRAELDGISRSRPTFQPGSLIPRRVLSGVATIGAMSLRDARRVGSLCAVVTIGALASFQAASASAGAAGTSRFSNRGISFSYPSSWYLTTRPLSNGVEPVYRFAVGNFRFHRTPRDVGPCLQGIAKQRTSTGVLAFIREAVGTDARRAHAGPRPKTFRLPAPTVHAACLGPGPGQ